MAKKKETTELPAEPAKETASEGTLVKAAKAIGAAAGKIAGAVGAGGARAKGGRDKETRKTPEEGQAQAAAATEEGGREEGRKKPLIAD